jgi:hypothetical protein
MYYMANATAIDAIQRWFIVHSRYREHLQCVFKVKDLNEDLVLNPKLLKNQCIPFAHVIQRVGDLLLIGPDYLYFGVTEVFPHPKQLITLGRNGINSRYVTDSIFINPTVKIVTI